MCLQPRVAAFSPAPSSSLGLLPPQWREMEICRRTRYFYVFPLVSLPTLSLFFSPLSSSSNRIPRCLRNFGRNPNPTPNLTSSSKVEEIVQLLKGNGGDTESNLDRMNLVLSPGLVDCVLRSLIEDGRSAYRFFSWAKNQPRFCANSMVYNQIIDLIGSIGDFESMSTLVQEVSALGYCLDERAFSFLVKNPAARDSVDRVVEIINAVGGGCRKSGIHSLISRLSRASLFDLAICVMEGTAKRTSYYNVLIGAKCRNGNFEDARRLLDEMRRMGCDPNVKSYNFLLGSLCKSGKIAEACELIEMMEHSGYRPDEITYEIIAYHACRIGRMDFAIEFLDRMLLEGLRPRFTTHAAFVKGYFYSGQVHGAHKFVAEMCHKDKSSANMNYSLLASLFQKSGNFIDGYSILIEMMEKGLKPNFPVYIKLLKDLHGSGRRDMAQDLEVMFSKFARIVSETKSG